MLFPFYNYNGDDWFILSEPEKVISMTEDPFNVHFLTENGIFSYDYMDEYFYYNIDLSYNLPREYNYHYIYYHPIIDYFFIITDYKIFYKSSVAFEWNSSNIESFDILNVDRIGFSDNFLIFDVNNFYVKIDLYTMRTTNNKKPIEGNINWLNNFVQIDLSQFFSLDKTFISSNVCYNSITNQVIFALNKQECPQGWLFTNYITDPTETEHIIISHYYDKNEDLWIGTSTGAIYKVDDLSYKIKRVNIGPRVEDISGIYKNKNNWYFFDKFFKRTGKLNQSYSGYFLSLWNENDDSWLHIPKNSDILINNSIINDIVQIDKFIFLLTLDGFLIFDLKLNKWYHNYDFIKNYDRSLWVLKNKKNKLYIGTASGFLIADFKVVNNKPNIYNAQYILNGYEIYDIAINGNQIYICSNNGLYSYNIQSQLLTLLDSNTYYDIELNNQNIFVINDNLWMINDSGRELISLNVNSFKFSGKNKICAHSSNEIKILDLESNNEWYLDLTDFNIKDIYSLDCDDEWLWFSDLNSLLFFKWSNYE